MRRTIIVILVLLLLCLPAQVWAQEPSWPAWLWNNNGGLGFPSFPPGEYPVHLCYSLGSCGSDTLTIGSDGSLYLNGSQFYTLGTTLSCLDASCQQLAIYTIFVDPMTMTQSYSAIVLHWDEWSTVVPVEQSTPQSTPTRRFPTPTPRHTPTPRPTVTPMPTPQDCPPESVSQQPPTVSTFEVWPPNPVVVGQGGQGLNLSVQVTSYPVVHRWWTREQRTTTECAWHGDPTTGQPDESVCECTPDGSAGCWPGWGWETAGEWYCQEHVQIIPDPIEADSFAAHARLHQTSIEWIQTDLANKYPGAQVHHPNWDLRGQPSGGCRPDGTCALEAYINFPFNDPGWYTVWVDGWTVGTVLTPPRTYRYQPPDPQPVFLIDTSLIPPVE